MGLGCKGLVFVTAALAAAACSPPVAAPPPVRAELAFETAGTVAAPELSEISGMAASRRMENVFWVVNDSGNPAMLHAVDGRGRHLGSVRLEGAANRDWEDLAAFRLEGVDYLLVADVGDNGAVRDRVDLFVVEEPVFGPDSLLPASVRPSGAMRFRFPDGPRDCESVAVVPDENRIYLVSKRTWPPVLYSLELVPSTPAPVLEARRLAEVLGLPGPGMEELAADPRQAVIGVQPTAMDISSDGRRAVVLTYREAYLYERPPGAEWREVLAGPAAALGLPRFSQAEAVCFTPDGRYLVVTGENPPVPMVRMDLGGLR